MQRQRNYEQDLQEARNEGFWVWGWRGLGSWVVLGVEGDSS